MKKELPLLREPWFAIVHYSSTHFPYRITEGDEPFQPASTSKSPDDNAELFNYYRNAVHGQDRTIADLMTALRASPAGARSVVLYTSDHGEAFREHGQLAHTSSVFEEEIHVPAWVDAPAGTLTEVERAALVSAKNEPVWHLDLPPTVLDLLGLWSLPETARFRAKMVGTSLLRKERTHAEVPLTNCSELWGCAFRNWGLMRGTLQARSARVGLRLALLGRGHRSARRARSGQSSLRGARAERGKSLRRFAQDRARSGSAKSRVPRSLRAEKAPC